MTRIQAGRRCLLLAAVTLLALVGLGLALRGAGRFLALDDDLAPLAAHPPDAIVVLGGGDSSRARHGVALFERGVAPLLVFSGGTLQDVGLACSSAQLALEDAQALGLPEGAALIAPEAQSTYDEALNLRALARERDWRSLVVVTDPLHTRRAARTFRALLPGVEVYVSAAPSDLYDPARWWQTEHGLVGVVNELLKLGFYWAKYSIRPF